MIIHCPLPFSAQAAQLGTYVGSNCSLSSASPTSFPFVCGWLDPKGWIYERIDAISSFSVFIKATVSPCPQGGQVSPVAMAAPLDTSFYPPKEGLFFGSVYPPFFFSIRSTVLAFREERD